MNAFDNLTLAVDFDGTLCENCFPDIGEPNTELIQKLISLREQGHHLILWTCREDDLLENAINFCKSFGLEFDSINNNTPVRVDKWKTNPRKVGADYYIDDRAVSPTFFVENILLGEQLNEKAKEQET